MPMETIVSVYYPALSAKKPDECFVYFFFADPGTGIKKRFRYWFSAKTEKEKKEKGEQLAHYYRQRLNSGWNPFIKEDKKVLYSEIEVKLWDIHKRITSGLSASTIKNYKIYTSNFLNFSKKIKGFEAINKNLCEDFFTSLEEYSAKSYNDHLTYLKRVFNILVEEKKLPENYLFSFKKKRKLSAPGKYYKEGLKNIVKNHLKEHDPYLWLYINFIYYGCIRPKEIRYLKIKDINIYDGVITVPSDISKNRKTQPVAMPFQLYELILSLKINQYPDHYYLFTNERKPGEKRIGVNYFNKRFREVRKVLGVPEDYKLYSFKHTANVSAVKAGINLKDMQLHNRHADLNTFDIYIRGMVPEESEAIRYQFPPL
jgi:integrase